MILKPYLSIGEIPFGAPRTLAQKEFSMPFESGEKRFGEIVDRYDYFIDLGIFVYYNAQGSIEAFEFFDPPGPELFGIHLLAISYSELLIALREMDASIVVQPSGTFTSLHLGIAGTPPRDGQATSPAETVMAFAKGYY